MLGPHTRTPTGPSDIFSRGRPICGMACVNIPSTPPISLIFCSRVSLASSSFARRSISAGVSRCARAVLAKVTAAAAAANKNRTKRERYWTFFIISGHLTGRKYTTIPSGCKRSASQAAVCGSFSSLCEPESHAAFRGAITPHARLALWARSRRWRISIQPSQTGGLFSASFAGSILFSAGSRSFCGPFRFILPQALNLKDFFGSFSGSFCPIFDSQSFVFNNFSGSFLQNRCFLSHGIEHLKAIALCFQQLDHSLQVCLDC